MLGRSRIPRIRLFAMTVPPDTEKRTIHFYSTEKNVISPTIFTYKHSNFQEHTPRGANHSQIQQPRCSYKFTTDRSEYELYVGAMRKKFKT
ncbi:unnamed protein product [Nesidiocoris tenuis]|uniref:Uncharacterized protein n=1 Tax=Nesidiocoris tenuis TaxID=355587 RepID=A0A6H5H3E7_9HEMI|nr:unnamed protein product [Nesidiocoris tenuis]